MARPTKNNPEGKQKMVKQSPETIGKLEQAFAIDATIAEACFYAGIHPSTYHDWVNADYKLNDRLQALRNNPVLTARQTVVKAIKTDSELALKYLERKKKLEFSPRIEQTGAGGGAIEMTNYNVDMLENKDLESILNIQDEIKRKKREKEENKK